LGEKNRHKVAVKKKTKKVFAIQQVFKGMNKINVLKIAKIINKHCNTYLK